MLHVLDTGVALAEENMKQDAHFLESLEPKDCPILHLYRWDGPSATYGYLTKPERYLDLERAKTRHLNFAKRPTGGGVTFHIWDLAFSFLMPSDHPLFSLNTLDNYRFVNEVVLSAVTGLFELKDSAKIIPESFPSFSKDCEHFCMAQPTQYDVVYKGLKIAGAAQRKTRRGYLHQGTISLAQPHFPLLKAVLKSEEILHAMANYTFAPLGSCHNARLLEEVRINLEARLKEKFMEKL